MKKTRTTHLHPQSDGLSILTSQHQRDWDQHLPLVLWAYSTAVQESSQCTPAALMFGRELRTPVDLVFVHPPSQKQAYDTRANGPTLRPGDRVWVFCPQRKWGLSPKLTHHWQGPGERTSSSPSAEMDNDGLRAEHQQ